MAVDHTPTVLVVPDMSTTNPTKKPPVNTYDAGWPVAEEMPHTDISQDVLGILCAPLVALVRGRKARGGTIPDREEVTARTSLCKVFESLGVTKASGRDWKVTYVPTRFRTIGEEILPVADESLRVTIKKTATYEERGRLSAVR